MLAQSINRYQNEDFLINNNGNIYIYNHILYFNYIN